MDYSNLNMSNSYPEDCEQVIVEGFEVPKSPDSSYNNEYPGTEEDTHDPPAIPPQLHNTLLHYPSSRSNSETLPPPHNVILNHLFLEQREAPKPVVGLGFTHRFLSKYVTAVLYKPNPKRQEAGLEDMTELAEGPIGRETLLAEGPIGRETQAQVRPSKRAKKRTRELRELEAEASL